MRKAKNVLGTEIVGCSVDPLTGFNRSGRCDNCSGDDGLHIVCAEMTEGFLAFSTENGNDLAAPMPELGFPGLQPGDRWCLCVRRWQEALRAGVAPLVSLEATHISALEFVSIEALQAHALIIEE